VWRRFIRQLEDYSHIQSSAEINIVGKQSDGWIVEVIGIIENKGKVQHKITEYKFNLDALREKDDVVPSDKWGGQVDFPLSLVEEGSLLPWHYDYFFIDPGVTARYSYIAKAPLETTFLNFHCWFKYTDRKKAGHTAEKTVQLKEIKE
jgi:hypothetical protein